jgi:hypothetical protein
MKRLGADFLKKPQSNELKLPSADSFSNSSVADEYLAYT